MKKLWNSIRHLLEYSGAVVVFWTIRHLPYRGVRLLAKACTGVLWLLPGYRRLILGNLRAALPELPETEVRRIGRASAWNLFFNLLEFFWIDGRPKRIRRCYVLPPAVESRLREIAAAGERIIFVNPHLGSWEASGLMAPYYAGIRMVAVAKPVRNPYVNRLLNGGSREKTPGLRIIFSRGAMRESLRALREGLGVGTLIDQNTRVRDGGVFIRFFGIPAPSSLAPATLMNYCRQHRIPARIVYGTSVRLADGRIHAFMEELPRPFAEYPDEAAVIQELMSISERYIRNYPEQYLWMYRRFQYIPPDCPPELRKRYPYYAREPEAKFFRRPARRG